MSDKLSRRKVPSQTSRKGSASSLLSRSKSSSSSSSLTAAAPASTAAASPSPSTGSELATTATAAGTALAAETLEVTSEEADYHICPPHFVAYVLPEDGHYIMHTRVVCRTGVMRIFVLTDESILKFSAEGEYKFIKRLSIRDMYRCGVFIKNPKKKVHFHVTWLKSPSAAELSKKHKVLGFGSGSASWIWLLKKEYICETLDERDDWKLALSTLWIRHWQRYLESELVPEPEIYQHHYLCCELSKKKLSVRYLVLTTHNIYNVRTKIVKDKIELADTNWVLPIQDIGCTTTYPKTDNRVVTMLVEANSVLRQSKVVREDVTFVFNNERERGDFEFELRRLYIRVKKARLVGVTVQPQ